MVREEQQRQSCPRVHRLWEREGKKRVTEEQGIEWKGEKRREKIGSGVGRERESSTSHDVVDCAVPVVDG